MYVLFPDTRDLPGGNSTAIAELERKLGRRLIWQTRLMPTVVDLCPVEDMLALIGSCAWLHPVHVMHKTRTETRWSRSARVFTPETEDE